MKWAQKKRRDKPDKEDKETEAAEDGGERNQNQVTKVLCGGREEKHLKSIIFIFLNLNDEAVGLRWKILQSPWVRWKF